jgi:hypothetical protein
MRGQLHSLRLALLLAFVAAAPLTFVGVLVDALRLAFAQI